MGYDPFEAELASFINSGGGITAAKFPEVGFTVEGTITDRRMTQQTHPETRELLFWYNSKPTEESKVPDSVKADEKQRVMQMLLTLQCEPTGITWETIRYRKVELPEDDGIRALYVKGRMQTAFAKGLQEAGAHVPEIGGYVRVTRGKDVGTKGGKYEAYTYTVKYTTAAKNDKRKDLVDFMAGAGVGAGPADAEADPFA